MSYIPLSNNEKDEPNDTQPLNHRNPIYPLLKYPQPKPIHTLCIPSPTQSPKSPPRCSSSNSSTSTGSTPSSRSTSTPAARSTASSTSTRNTECRCAPSSALDSSSSKYSGCRMASMATSASQYLTYHLVPRNVRVLYDNHPHCFGATYTNLWTGAQLAHGMDSPLLWDHLPPAGVHSLVHFCSFSLFKMGKLTQSQKALFLWKSPMAKVQ